ncbi:MAG TPA: protease HtpX, partial [Candidatus Dormibacteraeota bacterium]|nr:protease HtpX [Candidatus Dormibacteraeota bacterium]
MNQLKTAFWLVLLTVVLVLIGRLTFGVAGMYAFLGLALVMNASAYWFSDRIALASAQAREVGPEEAPML